MPKDASPVLQGLDSYLAAIRDTGQSLRRKFTGDPEGLAARFGLRLPEKPVKVMQQLGVYDPEKHGPIEPGLRDLVMDICLKEVESAVAVGPRGGGKSQGVSFIEFYMVFIELYDALNLGGSELQADQVYQYLLSYIDSDPYWRTLVKGETLISKTETVDDAWIRVLTASTKSVRSPHAGGWKARTKRYAGGILVIDEEAEADKNVVESALPTIDTARPSVNIRCSTFHNIDGSFAEVVENHEEMGYQMYRWDIFDVCEGCECTPGKCESKEKCFREDHYELYDDPETHEQVKKLIHRAYCGGRARYASGWVPMAEIEKLWRRIRRNHTKFEVEAMGSSPTAKGHVIKDMKKFKQNITPETGVSLYLPGAPIYINVDWGTVAAGVEVWQEQPGPKHILIECEQIEEAGVNQISAVVVGLWNKYINEVVEVAADIGGGGNYLNPHLRDVYGLTVRDVNFGTEKEAAAAAWNVYNEAEECTYPEEHEDFIRQAKKWKRKKGHIQKGDDHLCDTALCYFSRFIDTLGIKRTRVAPKTFASGDVISSGPREHQGRAIQHKRPRGRVPVIRTLGRK